MVSLAVVFSFVTAAFAVAFFVVCGAALVVSCLVVSAFVAISLVVSCTAFFVVSLGSTVELTFIVDTPSVGGFSFACVVSFPASFCVDMTVDIFLLVRWFDVAGCVSVVGGNEPGLLDGTPVDGSPVDGTPVDGTPVDGTPVDGTPVDGSPVDSTPVDVTPVDGTPVDGTPVDGSPVDGSPVDGSPVDKCFGDVWIKSFVLILANTFVGEFVDGTCVAPFEGGCPDGLLEIESPEGLLIDGGTDAFWYSTLDRPWEIC